MSQPMDAQRQNHILIAGGTALLVLTLAVIVSVLDASRGWAPSVSGPVLPAWQAGVTDVSEITLTQSEGSFTLRREAAGWVMPERDGYPVRPELVAELDTLLAGLSFIGARTADPEKFGRLGLAEPGAGDGAGVRLQVTGASGEVLADLVFGTVRGETIYLRQPGESRTYAGHLPAGLDAALIARPADEWLALDFISLGRSAIARTRIQPETGPEYLLERPASSVRNFALREPGGWQPITAGAGNGPASALSRIRFRDVRRADRMTGALVGYHEAETFEGLSVRLDIIAQGETRWALVRVNALTDDALDDARSLEMTSENWAYLLSDLSLDRLLRPLSEIADPRPQETLDAP